MPYSQNLYHFAVAEDRPLFATLEEYGEDGGQMHYFWLIGDSMGENLCKGLDGARGEANRLGLIMYSFESYSDAVVVAKSKACDNLLWESSNLFWVALSLAEHFEGATSGEYKNVCREFAPIARSMGNINLANDLESYFGNCEGL